MDYIARQIQEIRSTPILRIYGSLLSLLLVFASGDWLRVGVARALGRGTEAVCWPMFPGCQSWRVIETGGIQTVIVIFFLFSLLNAVLFLLPRLTREAFWMLLVLNIVKLCIISFDFRFRLNQHIMTVWVTMPFLFLPKKEQTLKVLIVFFYFWSGLLKLNSEWLSGSALYHKPWLVTPTTLPWACAYVVVLESLLAWLLWWDRSKLAWAVLIQCYIFHLLSFPVVGFFYPAMMGTILLIYPLSWIKGSTESVYRWLCDRRQAMGAYGLVVAFSLVQMIPRLMPGDSAVTGEGRLFALHMFDAYTECEVFAKLKEKNGRSRLINLQIDHPVRVHCDPITYLSRARYLCQQQRKLNPFFQELDLSLRTRRSNGSSFHQIVDLTDFCSKNIQYSLFTHNDWIRTD